MTWVSYDVPDELHKTVKIHAAERDLTIEEGYYELLREGLEATDG